MRVTVDIDVADILIKNLTQSCPFNGKIVEKVWGTEYWIVNNDKYCMKLLKINPGYQCSLHYHKIKDETFIVVSGTVGLEVFERGEDKKYHCLMHGGVYRLYPDTAHRFQACSIDPAMVIEISTTHDDDDVVRIEESRKIDQLID